MAPNRPGAYVDAFLADLAGNPLPDALTTSRVLHSIRIALLTQKAADTNTFPLTI
jgi:hypothetical protein